MKQGHDTVRVLARLKDFQRRTVEYVFRRFYTDPDSTDRFLVADEVGLGKTLVARGLIAKTIDYLQGKVDRIDIVYICSNISIASQNINRLNVSGVQEFVHPTRLSLLPIQIAGIQKNHLNYISLTPGTSFDPKSREGIIDERALIYYILKNRLDLKRSGFKRLLQCRVSDENWNRKIREWRPDSLDKSIEEKYIEDIQNDPDLYQRLVDFCIKSSRRVLWDDDERLRLVEILRLRLAEVSVEILEPDLIILDEFQRFKDLLDKKNPDAALAHRLFKYPGVKTLLLSATPYKVLSLNNEQEDDHYPDLLKTLHFLFDSDEEVELVEKEIRAFRQALYTVGVHADERQVSVSRERLQKHLSKVMCRTERGSMTKSCNAMLRECCSSPELKPSDLHQAALADQVAGCIGARDIMEYWKSSPYLINFLRRYEFRERLEHECENPSDELYEKLSMHQDRLLKSSALENYNEVDPANPRLRELYAQTIDRGLWRLLWLPPSMPYSSPEGAYKDVGDVTKSLVFSAWNVVPDAISALCSYEAERMMIAGRHIKHGELHEKTRPLLRFARDVNKRLTGMNVLILLYPCATLAHLVDPLHIALNHQGTGLISPEDLLQETEKILWPHLQELIKHAPTGGNEDLRWYWVVPAMMDRRNFPEMSTWLDDKYQGWRSMVVDDGDEKELRFFEHLDTFRDAMENVLDPQLGRPPDDLKRILAKMAVAGPGVCALRALKRHAPSLPYENTSLLQGTCRISEGFRTLFNLPETIAHLRGLETDTIYWRLVLRYCLDGNIQSMLDEHVHCLVESLGVIDKNEDQRASEIGESMGASLSMRTSQLQIDDIQVSRQERKIGLSPYKTRCRFALRFGELKDDKGTTIARADAVRDAFNSPFRPFILASTSIGQEGLDFHTWCHRVVHWNLPTNPVDLEQREGRVHRYKGHAIRKNIVRSYGLDSLRKYWDRKGDPWQFMFDLAKKDRPKDASDLVPYWLYEVEGGAYIERCLPILPFSKEDPHYLRLKKMLAVYRLVFGQPRQEDLLAYLAERVDTSIAEDVLDQWRISFEPKFND